VERKLIAYDIATKQRQIIKNNVLSFELSPQKDLIAIEEKLSGGKAELVLIDLNGNEKGVITQAKMIFGISWSPDQGKIAYVITSEDESKKGLYITEISSKKSLYVSPDYINIDNGLKWSPSGKKILASIAEVKNMKAMDNTYVISLR
jgi:TolB protein